MSDGPETTRFEEMLRRRGVSMGEDADRVEQEIRERFTDECAVLILDSSGFTRLTQAHGIIHFLALVVSMRDIAQPILTEHNAIAQWTDADNLYGIFPGARDAVDCALALQAKIQAVNSEREPHSRLAVCIGVGCGRMLRIGDENVYGDQMNLASKLGEDIAGANETLITEAVWEALGGEQSGLQVEQLTQKISGVELSYYRVQIP